MGFNLMEQGVYRARVQLVKGASWEMKPERLMGPRTSRALSLDLKLQKTKKAMRASGKR